jgi:hypothetical protein
MARIRSVHPGLFTDEAFVSLSMTARVLYIGIWTEADDHGIFEWKPLQFKMKLMPADAVETSALMEEMVTCNSVKRFTSDDKSYGLVRNFCRYQRPKKPKYTYFMPPELRTYAGLNDDGSLQVLHQSSTDPEKPSLREEGGDLRKEESGLGEGVKPARAKVLKTDFGREGPLTIDFSASDETRQEIRGMGFGDEQYNNEFSKFIAYYMARGTVRPNWNAQLVSWFQRATPEPTKPAAKDFFVDKVFVIEGTLGWKSWVAHTKEIRGITWSRTIERKDDAGRIQVGWWWPKEFAPGYDEATGEKLPPASEEENAA